MHIAAKIIILKIVLSDFAIMPVKINKLFWLTTFARNSNQPLNGAAIFVAKCAALTINLFSHCARQVETKAINPIL
jgi:hypothetical protein